MPLTRDEIEERLARMTDACRRRGIRLTRQRLEVFRVVASTTAHPDAEAVCQAVRKRLPGISLDTVYRTLASLEGLGSLSRVSALHGAARFDANTERHHHLVCTQCGLVRDFRSPALDAFAPPDDVRGWGRITSVHAELRGICEDCLPTLEADRPS